MKKENCRLSTTISQAQPKIILQKTRLPLAERTKASFKQGLQKYAELLSILTDEHITPEEAMHATHAIVALIISVFPVAMPLTVRCILLIWLGTTIYQCRKMGD